MKKIRKHEMKIYNTKAMISTAEIFGEYETMVMFEDGDELECYTSDTLEEALKIHDELVTKYNNDIYERSTAKLLGAKNNGQFVIQVY